MGQAIPLGNDYTADQLRRLARQTKDVSQARRMLAIAAVLDGASRAEAARIGGMDRQTLRDWVIRFNEEGPDGLVNKSSPGAPGKLTEEHKAFLVRLVEEGPIPAASSRELPFSTAAIANSRRACAASFTRVARRRSSRLE